MSSDVLRDAARVLALVAVVTTVTALAIAITDLRVPARGFFDLALPPGPAPLRAASSIAVDNLRLALLPVGGAVVVRLTPRARVAVDVVVAGVLALNAGLVGAALGAYGTSLLAAVALHGPPELAGFALAGSAYLGARRRPVPARRLGAQVGAAVLLIGIAAVLETCGGV